MTTDVFSPTSAGSEPLIERLRRATIGRYDIYAELGSGGMASVFLALDLALDRKVAIKVMSPALTSSPDALQRFQREAKVAASLSHPNIIAVYAVGEDPDLAYFVMKYVEGRSLDSVIKEGGAQSVPFVQTIISYAGAALYYAHQRGVVHRDVKPANFMLDQDGWLVVTDFGIAKMDDGHGLTMSGTLIGTPYYMSPEQFNGVQVTGASDQYALGIVAYELLTGHTPYNGPTLAEVMRGHLLDEVPPVRLEQPEVPPALEACIARMLAKSAADRFPTLGDAVAEFGAVSPVVEAQVRTQIISLARSGAAHQPRMSVPLSPIPVRRISAAAPQRTQARQSVPDGTPVARHSARAAATPVLAAPAVPAVPRKSALRWLVPLALVAASVAGVAVLRPDLMGLGARSGTLTSVAGAPPVVSAPVASPTQPDSLAAALALGAGVAGGNPTPVPAAPAVDTVKPKVVAKVPVPKPAAKPAGPAPAPPRAKPETVVVQQAAKAVVETLTVIQQAKAVVETVTVAAKEPEPVPVPVATGPGRIRIGSRMPLAILSINGDPRPISSPVWLSIPSGPVRLTVKAENCGVTWDTTFTVGAGVDHSIGLRPVRC